MIPFNNRVFGVAVIRAINSNYNADFTHQPRTLPDGTVYATDKAFKYSVRHYLKNHYPDEKIFFYKRLNENMNPLTLDETYIELYGEYPKTKIQKKNKEEEFLNKRAILANLLSCLDIRLFGATFAGETNISIHGSVQVNHGINRFPKNEIYSEQIMSPFRNPGVDPTSQKEMTTLGHQSKLREGHYVHHFSINPQNLDSAIALVDGASGLTNEDIAKLKEAMCKGVTYYDSASKAGTDNELLLWVQLKEASKAVLPVFTEFINIKREGQKVIVHLGDLLNILSKINDQIEKIEAYYQSENTQILNLPDNTVHLDLVKNEG